ncbi:hypothetical protein HMPREF0542_11115 [Ligilactobacillus ruminis ATCC 25644]|uniref:Uncharacterized protein n=1 Tax=Ligilactobacillus ruminis ATCC 25644 TaxID=525362 RepID=E7FQD8_9LACO|nr:hypothetical protein HMPREF0542_11115 [Ligilactobacillus ruminis ATCC 25644]EGX97374.1 hypothetical protein ANHS_2118 [Ligilactobacillus ruminis ATCC 25644]
MTSGDIATDFLKQKNQDSFFESWFFVVLLMKNAVPKIYLMTKK